MDDSGSKPVWPEETDGFLQRLAAAALAAGFAERPRFASVEPSWCAAMEVKGPLGPYELQLWTTPALADLAQAHLWVMRADAEGAIDLDKGRIAIVRFEGDEEIHEHVTYVRAALQAAENEPALQMAMRVAVDPTQRHKRAEFLERLRGGAAARKGSPS